MAEYVCEECSKSFDSERSLSLHKQQEHGSGSRGQYGGSRNISSKEESSADSEVANKGENIANENVREIKGKGNQKGGHGKNENKNRNIEQSGEALNDNNDIPDSTREGG